MKLLLPSLFPNNKLSIFSLLFFTCPINTYCDSDKSITFPPYCFDKVIALSDDEEKISLSDGSVYRVKHETFTGDTGQLDAGYRYEGANPDNYVLYNNELIHN